MEEERRFTLNLAITCRQLYIAAKSPLTAPGFFNSLIGKTRRGKGEKRQIRLFQSECYPPGGRPVGLKWETIYESEVIESRTDLRPSLVANVSCPDTMDCKIRVYVYYISNLTSGKVTIHIVFVSCLYLIFQRICTILFILAQYMAAIGYALPEFSFLIFSL